MKSGKNQEGYSEDTSVIYKQKVLFLVLSLLINTMKEKKNSSFRIIIIIIMIDVHYYLFPYDNRLYNTGDDLL